MSFLNLYLHFRDLSDVMADISNVSSHFGKERLIMSKEPMLIVHPTMKLIISIERLFI